MSDEDQGRPVTRNELTPRERAAHAWRRREAQHLPFLGRGFSDRTIKALTAAGVEMREQLPFIAYRRSELLLVPRVGEVGLAEIEA